MRDDDLYDALDDLLHDLGKHIALPLNLLPDGAKPGALREAATVALLKTRRSAGVGTPAAQIWADFLEEHPQASALAGFEGMRRAVDRALAWAARLDQLEEAPLRAALRAVGPAIRACLDELEP